MFFLFYYHQPNLGSLLKLWVFIMCRKTTSVYSEAAAPNESEALGPDGEEEPGIFQVLDRLEKITDTLLSK